MGSGIFLPATGNPFDQGIDSGTPLACGWTLVFGLLLGV